MTTTRRGTALVLTALLLLSMATASSAAAADRTRDAGALTAAASSAAEPSAAASSPAATEAAIAEAAVAEAAAARRLLVTLRPGRTLSELAGLPLGDATLRSVSANVHVVETAGSAAAEELHERLGAEREVVAHVEPDELIEVTRTAQAGVAASLASQISDDPLVGEQWALRNTGQLIEGRTGTSGIDVRVADAWLRTRGREEVVVAVIDSGVDATHRDLAGQLWVNERAGTARDGCAARPYLDDRHGWNFVHDDPDVIDTDGHGTAVASIIAARADDSFGMAGLAPDVRLMVLRTFQSTPSGGLSSSLSDLVCAITYAADHGADVINASWVTYRESPALRAVIAAVDIPIVAAAGNDTRDPSRSPSDPIAYPAGYELPNVVSVTALDPRGGVPRFANTDRRRVHLAAPGTSITVAALDGGHRLAHGTSFAAPFVTAALALALSEAPYADTSDLIDTLERTSRPLPTLETVTMTGGMLDAGALVAGVERPICRPDRLRGHAFGDVAGDSVHAASIACLVDREIAAGRRDGAFEPGALVTRAQLASFLARMVDAAGALPSPAPRTFPDLGSSVHAEAIEALAALGIVQGDASGRFHPHRPVRRDQLASMLVRTHEVLTGRSRQPSRSWFGDTEGSVHGSAIDAARDLGAVRGLRRGRFGPGEPARRDHVASFLARSVDALAREGLRFDG